MSERSTYEQKSLSPTGLTIVVAAHVAAIAALALARMDMPAFVPPGPLTVRNIPINPDPPPIPPEPVKTEIKQPKSVLDTPRPIIQPKPSESDPIAPSDPVPPMFGHKAGTEDVPKVLPPAPPPPPQAIPDPVRTPARMKAGIELLPPYPPAEERAEREGTVVVRLVIGPDGRVKAVEKISAASEAFWRATERHALRAWRFTPATVDGKPVEATQTLTVKFELRG